MNRAINCFMCVVLFDEVVPTPSRVRDAVSPVEAGETTHDYLTAFALAEPTPTAVPRSTNQVL
jgi:hypothetical protein